ncbi:putative nucleic acid-binding protein, contains PIN domain [Haloechinothrix halophila YIM 93223]|uniref:Ribonuclease VapC n=1 Tax=Haloechinothrix halophila YIM 93223 TaxID=592678 RepID=W9DS14_9PSEU|nr:putative nucleic acid-binding protein, contains PIN domain [Haloechinothrix halophila YIM 93223]
MIVVDASVLTNMLTYTDQRGRKARAVLSRDTRWAAPEHWKAEVFSAIRGLALGGKITTERATWALDRLPQLGMDHVSLDDLLSRMWRLRESISGYDAAYVALAEQRGLTLTTSDARLARAATAHCRVELVA